VSLYPLFQREQPILPNLQGRCCQSYPVFPKTKSPGGISWGVDTYHDNTVATRASETAGLIIVIKANAANVPLRDKGE
jgi:hypothetical protein